MNIAEILKDCPKGTKLYSFICGECELVCVERVDSENKICVKSTTTNTGYWLNHNGTVDRVNEGECLLFPSKENRDWLTFKPKKEYQFKPFDKVLVRYDDNQEWGVDLFSHITNSEAEKNCCIGGNWKQCIPYEGNEHLLGTTNNPE